MAAAHGTEARSKKLSQNIVFFHPDLGIGGAERLIVDAAVGLQNRGHKVTIFTSHCDPTHCFDEVKDGTLDVRVRGHTIFPPVIFNRFHILLAILRQLHLVLSIAVFGDELWDLKPDVFIVDQLSACIPLLRWTFPKRQRTLFYCHFPDQLLVQRQEKGLSKIVKDIYRFPFDWFEGWSTGASDRVVVNSNFTKTVARNVFPHLASDLGVIYPCVGETSAVQETEILWDGRYKILLSINRFERKKDIGLALRAYKTLSTQERASTRLILAGGYDARVNENVTYHKELVEMAETFGLKQATAKTVPTALAVPSDVEVLFLLSVPGAFKDVLLQNAKLLLYTPANEHFGIVPVEAMQHGVPVLASNTGGPLETVVEGETGWLRDVARVEDWTTVMLKVLHKSSAQEMKSIGESGQQRVRDHFLRPIMAAEFDANITSMINSPRSGFVERGDVGMAVGLVGAFLAAFLTVIFNVYFTAPGYDPRTTEFVRVKRASPVQRAGADAIPRIM